MGNKNDKKDNQKKDEGKSNPKIVMQLKEAYNDKKCNSSISKITNKEDEKKQEWKPNPKITMHFLKRDPANCYPHSSEELKKIEEISEEKETADSK